MRLRAFSAAVIVFGSSALFAHDGNQAMVDAANAFVKTLSAEQKQQLSFKFNDKERQNWHFIPKDTRPGVRITNLDLKQRRAAHALMRTALSPEGYLKATHIMALEEILRVLEKGRRPDIDEWRDQEKYYFSIFGTPSTKKPWGWRVEGHHLSLNFSAVTGSVTASTPLFLGANPSEVRSGPQAGLRVMGAEEDLARAIITSLKPALKKKAVIMEKAPRDVLTTPGNSTDLGKPKGVASTELDKANKGRLWGLVAAIVNTLRADLAKEEFIAIKKAGFDNVYFAWAGGVKMGEGHYWRVHGPTFLIEYDSTQNEANHAHLVWHSLPTDFGLDALKKHYEQSHKK